MQILQKANGCIRTFISDLAYNHLVKARRNIDPDLFYKMIYISLLIALILALPGISVLLAIYYTTDNLLLAALIGFSIHFATLAFIHRISEALTRFFS